MKKILYITATFVILALTGCEAMLDTQSYTKSTTGNFPANENDVTMMITAIYATLNQATCNPVSTYFYFSELASDDRYGGGGENDKSSMATDKIMRSDEVTYDPFWTIRYRGIYRANTAIEAMTNPDLIIEMDENKKNQFLGEAYFLRAFFYHELAEMFGEVPLITATTQETNAPKAPADSIYAVIASDLKNAINLMSNAQYNAYVVSGHATKWAAEALMARVFLFYTGFYNKTELPSLEGSVSKSEVIAWVDDCVANSGHDLVGDYRNLWTYTNPFTAEDYNFTAGKQLAWEGNGNKETVFAVKYCNYAGWNDTYQMGYTNQYILYFGLRADNGTANSFPFGQGWGQGPVAPTIWNDWVAAEPNDMRRTASILDVDDPAEGLVAYTYGADKQMEEAGLWNKKMLPISTNLFGEWPNTFWCQYDEYTTSNNGSHMQGAHYQDLVVIRFADVLLMQSELKEDATGMNRVRARAKLPSVSYSLAALQNERRWELCFEGRRWADIRRWGIATQVLDSQLNQDIFNKGEATTMKAFGGGYAARYQATGGGFVAIPSAQVALSEGVLTQNEGWGSEALFSAWE